MREHQCKDRKGENVMFASVAALVRAANEAREAFDAGRIRQFRALFHLGAVRKLMNPEIYEK